MEQQLAMEVGGALQRLSYHLYLDVNLEGVVDATVFIYGPEQERDLSSLVDELRDRIEEKHLGVATLIGLAKGAAWHGRLPHDYRAQDQLRDDNDKVREIISGYSDQDIESLKITAWSYEIHDDRGVVEAGSSSIGAAPQG